MRCRSERMPGQGRQRGFTILLVMLVLLVGGTSVYVTARDPAEARAAQSLQQSTVDLRGAVTNLAVYSISDNQRPGSMPCPDDDGDGTAELFAGSDCPDYLARLPWKTIDAAREAGKLWYVMDPDFRDHSNVEPLNVVVPGSLTLNGVGGYAALVIHPGDPIEGQTGRPSDTLSDYLEDVAENTDGDDDFVDCTGIAGCNDRIIGITVDQLFAVVQQRVLAEVELALRQFHTTNNFLPYAAAFNGGASCDKYALIGRIATHEGDCGSGKSLTAGDLPTWVMNNDWNEHVFYTLDYECSEQQKNCGASTYRLKSNSGLAVVLGGAGSLLSGQDRTYGSGRTIDDYLDGAENTDFDAEYDDVTLADDDNDVMRGFALP